MSETEPVTKKKHNFKVPFYPVCILGVISIIASAVFNLYIDVIMYSIPALQFRFIIFALLTAVALFIIVYHMIKRTHPERVSAVLCIYSAGYLIKTYVTSMTYGDFFIFIEAFFIVLMSTLQIAFSIDLFRGMKESAAILKTIMLVNVLFTLILSGIDYVRYITYLDTWYLMIQAFSFFQIIISIFSYASLHSEEVLKGQKVRTSELRIPILSAIMMLYGAIYLFNLQPAMEYSNSGFAIATNILFILVGLFFLLYRDVDTMSALSIMLVVIGISTVIKSIPDLFSTDGVKMLLGIVSCLAGFACIILCALMYSGDKFNSRRLQIIMLVLLAASVIPIIFDARIHPDPAYLVIQQSDRFLTAVLVGGTFLALTDKSIKYTGVKDRMAFNVHTMNNTVCNDADASISRSALYELYRSSGWTYPDGPVEKEKTVKVYINGADYPLTVRKWKDSGRITGEMHSSNEGTYIQALRFEICKVIMDGTIEDCSKLTIYGEKGFFIVVPVIDAEKFIETKPVLKVYFKIIGHKNTKVIKEKFEDSVES